MGNTWVIDLSHHLTPAGAIAELPSGAKLLAEYFASIVVEATSTPDDPPIHPRFDVGAGPNTDVAQGSSCHILPMTSMTAFAGTARHVTTIASSVAGRTLSGTASTTMTLRVADLPSDKHHPSLCIDARRYQTNRHAVDTHRCTHQGRRSDYLGSNGATGWCPGRRKRPGYLRCTVPRTTEILCRIAATTRSGNRSSAERWNAHQRSR